jgi:NADPH2:quinone reductase
MRQWQVQTLGEPRDVLKLVDVPKPDVKVGQVRIRVEAAAVNFLDILVCQGKYQEKPPLPFTPGAEIAGVVEEVGEGASLHIGQRVVAMCALPNGGFSEYVSVSERDVYAMPESITAPEAAAHFITYQTAYYALHTCANLQPGETLLVHAGAGGVGSAAIQIGKAAGAVVIATAGGAEKVDICRRLGADEVVDYRAGSFIDVVKERTQGRGADVVFDPVGGDVFDASRKCISFMGRLLVIGFAGGRIADAPTNHALVKNYSIVGVHWGLFRRLMPEKVRDIEDRLVDMMLEASIQPLIYKEYPFDTLPDALEELATRKTWGQLILNP